MRKASRLFEIIQMLRVSEGPLTAARMARELKVTPRSVYRDIVALQAMQIPIQGGRGIGYVLRPGFELPPLMFSVEETEAIVLALAFLDRTGDVSLKGAAKSVNKKIAAVMPSPLRQALNAKALHAWGAASPEPTGIDLAMVRGAIREEQIIDIAYCDELGRASQREIRPIALIYYPEAANVVAWCQLRRDLRNFRADRVVSARLTGATFKGEGDELRRRWVAGWASKAPSLQ